MHAHTISSTGMNERNESYVLQIPRRHNGTLPSIPSRVGNYVNVLIANDAATDDYDTIATYSQVHTNTAKADLSPPVTVEASKREEEFFIAEDHTYAVVDKSKKRKARKTQENEGTNKREDDAEKMESNHEEILVEQRTAAVSSSNEALITNTEPDTNELNLGTD